MQRGNSQNWYNSEQYREESLASDRYELIRSNLNEEIVEGLAQVSLDGDDVIITLSEQGSFQSGSAELEQSFFDVLNRVGASLVGVEAWLRSRVIQIMCPLHSGAGIEITGTCSRQIL